MSQFAMAKATRFCFTLNNYKDSDVQILEGDLSGTFTYWCFGKEVGEMLTPHLQGYFEFPNAQRMRISAAKSRWDALGLSSAHLAIAKGTAQHNIDYCSKEGQFHEGGTRPKGKGKRTDLDVVCDAIANGSSMPQLIESFPSQVVKFRGGIEFLIQAQQPRRRFKTEVWWLYGPTGSGKSRWAWSQDEMSYMKVSSHKWWNGYIGQESVIIDDYRPSKEMPFNFMLNLFDRYPLSVETKGGMVEFLAKRIYVTSPFSVEETCNQLDWIGVEQRAQLIRRVDHVIRFPQLAMMYVDLTEAREKEVVDLTQT